MSEASVEGAASTAGEAGTIPASEAPEGALALSAAAVVEPDLSEKSEVPDKVETPEHDGEPIASAEGDATTTLEALKTEVVAFADARAWGAFHTPGELVKALSVEAGELLQLFLWVTGDAGGREAPSRERVEEEVADVAMCLLNLCHRSGLDLSAAVRKKLIKTGEKYPVARARGRAGKYDEL